MKTGPRASIARRSIGLVAVLFIAAACHRWAPAAGQPKQGAAVRVSYAHPRDVIATNGAGDSVRIAGVSHLAGAVVRAVPDTLHVRVIAANGSPAIVPDGNTVVAVVRGPDVTVTHRVIQRVRTVLAVWLVVSIVGVIIFGPGDTSFY